jgi:hypothetical protein
MPRHGGPDLLGRRAGAQAEQVAADPIGSIAMFARTVLPPTKTLPGRLVG